MIGTVQHAERSPSLVRAGIAVAGLLTLAACASVEDACERAGLTAGTAAFDQCVAKKRAERTKNIGRGGRGWGGPGGGGL